MCNATFNNISAISCRRPALVVQEAGIPGENHRPWASNWQTLSLAAASRMHPFCNLQSRARTHAVLVIGLYEFSGNPTTQFIEPIGPRNIVESSAKHHKPTTINLINRQTQSNTIILSFKKQLTIHIDKNHRITTRFQTAPYKHFLHEHNVNLIHIIIKRKTKQIPQCQNSSGKSQNKRQNIYP